MELLKKRNRSHECFEDSKSNNNKDEHKKNEMPNFLLKLYRILETPEFNKIIEWGDNGRYFIVKNLNEFTEKILPQYYKHSNFSSFVRQVRRMINS